MLADTTLTMVDGVKVVVPDSLDLITPYVLREQLDWFEDEIKFLRRLLKPGQRVIDIGANLGVYALTMARAVAEDGWVWCFEPAAETAAYLAAGIRANGFEHVVLNQSAVGASCGTARLTNKQQSEANALIADDEPADASEVVAVVTLDHCLDLYGWSDIDFVKIDAEGQESNIVRGGARFFAQLSPLVQYEVKAGPSLQMSLVMDFAAIGYDTYRLVPGLNLLVPLGPDEVPDKFVLNLFACKPGRALSLKAAGFLIDRESLQDGAIPSRAPFGAPGDTLSALPYAAALQSTWAAAGHTPLGAKVAEAIAWYTLSRDDRSAPAQRYQALAKAYTLLYAVCEQEHSRLRLASLARVACDYGTRSVAVSSLGFLFNALSQSRQMDVSEPFLVPDARLEAVMPGTAIGNWLMSAILEAYERLHTYSSFYTAGPQTAQHLEALIGLGFASEEMSRRLSLVRERFAPDASRTGS